MNTQIYSLHELDRAIKKKKAVFCPNSHTFKKSVPAAFIINMPGTIILRLFNMGLFIYEKNKKEKK